MSIFKRLLAFTILLAWCAVLLGYRIARTDSSAYTFLAWNLFLATVPLVAAASLLSMHRARGPATLQLLAFAVWLLFLPNAPYILTDFIHLKESESIPLWYDIALLASGAGTGVLFAYASTAYVQAVVADRLGRLAGWAVAFVAFVLSGFGIYLGRFLRWNSWDALTEPARVFHDIVPRVVDPLAHLGTLGVTLIYGVGLTLGYAAVRSIPPPRVRDEE
ncbi:MAG TPA: DUF1361 domain-containing protein [Thermoanaerobaculia bacterium]